MHDDAVAGAFQTVGRDRDQAAFAFRIVLEGKPVHDKRIIAHHAELKLVRHHPVGHRRARCKILPFELEFDVRVFAVLGQVFLHEMEFANDRACCCRVGGGVLGADADRHRGLRASRAGESKRRRGDDDCRKAAISEIATHCRPSSVFDCASDMTPCFWVSFVDPPHGANVVSSKRSISCRQTLAA